MTTAKFVPFVLAAVLLVSPGLASAATNLVTNGDLEAGTTNAPTGWATDSWGTLTAKFSYPVAGVSGSKAARVELTKRTSGDTKWYFTPISVKAGTTYQISDSYRSNVATEIDVMFIVNGKETYAYLTAPASSNGAWTNYAGSIKAPTGATSMTVMHLIQKVGYLELDNMVVSDGSETTPPPPPPPPPAPALAPTCILSASPVQINLGEASVLSWSTTNATMVGISGGVGNVATTSGTKTVSPTATTTYVLTAGNNATTTVATCVASVGVTQPIVVTPPPATTTPTSTPPVAGPNLISNGNLEQGNTNAPTGWNADYWGTMTAKFTYPVAGKGGGKAAQVTVTNYKSGDAKWDFNHVAVSSHSIYQYSEDYLSNVKTNVTVEYKMSNGTFDYEWLGDLPAVSAWTPWTMQITVPKGAVSFTILHSLVSNGSLSLDNVTLNALTNDQFSNGMVTLVFDDGLASQYKNALPILTTAGYKATFGIITTEPASGDSAYMNWAKIKDLSAKGHEINSHSRTHPALTTLTSTQLQNEVVGSYNDLVAQGLTPTTFIYPLGDVNATVEAAVKAAGYVGARGSNFGLNNTVTDDYNLFDIRLDKSSKLATIQKYIDQVVEDKRWLVFEIHDVVASGGDDYAITPAFLQSVVNYLKTKGVTVVTLNTGLGL